MSKLNDDLSKKKCQPCEGGLDPMTYDEAKHLLSKLSNGWILSQDGKKIYKDYKTKNYYEITSLINLVIWLSNKEDHHPEIILAGRRLNDGMGSYISSQLISAMKAKDIKVEDSNVLVMGLTFKENCPDTRNSKVLDLFNLFKKKNFLISSYDPNHKLWNKTFKKKFNVIENIKNQKFDLVIIAVKHKKFIKIKNKISKLCNSDGFIYDLKYLLPEDSNSYRL